MDVVDVGKIYFDLGEKLHYNWLHVKVNQLPSGRYWERMLVKSLKDDIYDQQRELTMRVVKVQEDGIKNKMSKWIKKNAREVLVLGEFIKNMKCLDDIDSAKLVVAIKQSGTLIK